MPSGLHALDLLPPRALAAILLAEELAGGRGDCDGAGEDRKGQAAVRAAVAGAPGGGHGRRGEPRTPACPPSRWAWPWRPSRGGSLCGRDPVGGSGAGGAKPMRPCGQDVAGSSMGGRERKALFTLKKLQNTNNTFVCI